jgi:hypothetical protein
MYALFYVSAGFECFLFIHILTFFLSEQCAQHNSSRERLRKDCELKTDFLKRHLKRLEEERTNEFQELSRNNEMRIRQAVR